MSRSLFLTAIAACCTVSGFAHAQQPVPKMKQPPEPKTFDNGWIGDHKLDPVIVNAIKPDPTDSPLRKLQKERCREKAHYFDKVTMLIELGRWNPQDFEEYLKTAATLADNLMELVDKPTDKLKCLELRLAFAKSFEKFAETRATVGTDPPQNIYIARSARLEAEIQILKLKAEIEKSQVAPATPVSVPTFTTITYYNYQPVRTYPAAVWSPSTGWTYPSAAWNPSVGWYFPGGYPIPGRIFLGGG